MKVLLINPAPVFYTGSVSTSAPLGLLSIATFLRQHGHTVILYDRTVKHRSAKKVIEEFKPDVVGVSFFAFKGVNDSIRISAYCRRKGVPVVWGGQMASVLVDYVLETGVVDYIVMGEGEITFLELLDVIQNRESPDSVAGLAFIDNGSIKINPCREFANLADLPIIDWTFVKPELYFQSSFGCKKMMYVYYSKGCPGICDFCTNSTFHRSTYRKRPVEYVLSEIKYLTDNYGLDGVYFAADLFCSNKDEMYKICEMRKDMGLTFVWGGQTRIGIFDEQDFKYMHENGCRWLFFGVESGSPKMLKKMKKNMDLSLVNSTFSACADIGIVTIASFIIALPGETYQDIMETIDLALSLDSAMCTFNCLATCPGAENWTKTQQEGLYTPPSKLQDLAKVHFIDEPIPNLSEIPTKDTIIIRDYFQWLSFSTPKTPTDSTPRYFAKKVILDTIRTFFANGPTYFFLTSYAAGRKFFSIVYNVYFHPRIRKKYNLYRRNGCDNVPK